MVRYHTHVYDMYILLIIERIVWSNIYICRKRYCQDWRQCK